MSSTSRTHSAGESDSPVSPDIARAYDYIRPKIITRPKLGLVLGTGLGDTIDEMRNVTSIDYSELPEFPRSTAVGHRGRFLLGSFSGTPTVAMDGRCHLYEGYSASQVTMGVRLMASLGVEVLVITNASGGMNPKLRSADVLVMADHLNLMGRRLSAFESSSARTPSKLTSLYCPRLIDIALASAREHNFMAMTGTYAGFLGPNYETRAEYRFLRRVGADVVGMSTVPEVLSLASSNVRVLGLSIVTNCAKPDAPSTTTAHEVVNIASLAAEKLRKIIRKVGQSLNA